MSNAKRDRLIIIEPSHWQKLRSYLYIYHLNGSEEALTKAKECHQRHIDEGGQP